VTTPQKLAFVDVAKGIRMFARMAVPCAAVAENMSYFDGADGVRYRPFGAGSGARIVRDFGLPNLVQFPIVPELSAAGDGARAPDARSACCNCGRAGWLTRFAWGVGVCTGACTSLGYGSKSILVPVNTTLADARFIDHQRRRAILPVHDQRRIFARLFARLFAFSVFADIGLSCWAARRRAAAGGGGAHGPDSTGVHGAGRGGRAGDRQAAAAAAQRRAVRCTPRLSMADRGSRAGAPSHSLPTPAVCIIRVHRGVRRDGDAQACDRPHACDAALSAGAGQV